MVARKEAKVKKVKKSSTPKTKKATGKVAKVKTEKVAKVKKTKVKPATTKKVAKETTKKTASKKTQVKQTLPVIAASKKSDIKRLIVTKDVVTPNELPTEYEELKLTKYETGAHTAHTGYSYDPMRTEEPPSNYGIDRIIILPIDPHFAFVYWEATEGSLHSFHERHGWDAKLVVRISDVTNINYDGGNAHEWWDLEVNNRIASWYIRHWKGDRNLLAEIGLKTSDGRFISISRSKSVYCPRDKMVPPGKILWMLVDEFGNKLISEVEDFTDEDLALLRKILGEDRFKRLVKGDLSIFFGASAWGRIPVIDNYIDLSKIPSFTGASGLPSSRSGSRIK